VTDLGHPPRPEPLLAPVEKPGRQDWSTWPRYEAATLGLRNYWYPVLWSRSLREKKPKAIRHLGEEIMVVRADGKVHALHDRCPHRGVRLSHPMATQEFPGTWSCCYHGWTYDLTSGVLVAAITDGPDSKMCGRVSVKTYPVEERAGLIWLYVGEEPPPPVEDDIPEELLADRTLVVGKRTTRTGDWRFGAENGFDHGHAKYLHRRTLWTFFRQMSAYSLADTVDEDPWLTQIKSSFGYQPEYPGLGKWPRKMKRITYKFPPAVVSIRLPGILRVKYRTWNHYEWWFPQDGERHTYVQVIATRQNVLRRALFKLWYYTWVRWVFHGMFNAEDALMVDVMDAPPELLYRPDHNLIDWRRHVDDKARPQPTDGAATGSPVRVTRRRSSDELIAEGIES
jgi:phenylpropionate dioxygenase-like ring-hydroxylating dioxygenase large terminal subunit